MANELEELYGCVDEEFDPYNIAHVKKLMTDFVDVLKENVTLVEYGIELQQQVSELNRILNDNAFLIKQNKRLENKNKKLSQFVEELCIVDCGFDPSKESKESLIDIIESWDVNARKLLANLKEGA